MKHSLLSLLALILILCSPAALWAQEQVVMSQDSCVVVGGGQVRVYFTLTNLSADDHSICAFSLEPDPSPASPECTITDAHGEELWAFSPHAAGGVWFGVPPFAAPWAGLGAGTSLGGFYVTIDPSGDCCYTVEFADDMFQDWWSLTWCVTICDPVPTRQVDWSTIKRMYE